MKVISYSTGRVIPGRFSDFLKARPVTLGAILLASLLSLLPGLADWATWNAANPASLQIWLSHFTHWSANHLLWDLLTFGVLAGLLEQTNRRLLLRLLIWVPPAIILSIWITGDFSSYRGLSGLDCGLYAAALVVLWKNKRLSILMAAVALILLMGKSTYELITSSAFFVSDLPQGINAVPIAHLAGALVGAGIVGLSCYTKPMAG